MNKQRYQFRYAPVLAAALLIPAMAFAAGSKETTGLADFDGKHIEYVVSGPQDGEAILFIHGTGLADSFLPITQQPALAKYRLIRIHRQGYAGSSPRTYPISMQEEAAQAVAVLDALHIRRAHVASHSGGGPVANQMAARMPERVATLIYAEAGPPEGSIARALGEDVDSSPPTGPLPKWVTELRELKAAGDWKAAVATLFTAVFGDDWREVFDAVPGGYEQTLADAPQFLTYDFGSIAFRLAGAYPPDIRALSMPILILQGAEAAKRDRANLDRALHALPDAEEKDFPGTDHAFIVQKPREVAEAIADFVARHPVRSGN